MIRFIKSLYLTSRLWVIALSIIFLFIFSYFFGWMLPVAKIAFFGFVGAIVSDTFLLYSIRKGVFARREAPEKLSNGDENDLSIFLSSFYSFPVHLRVVDEIPFQFQKRDLEFRTVLSPSKTKILTYQLRPVKRGEYNFGAVNVYAASPIGLVLRRYQYDQDKMVPVYPSFLQMRKYELMAISNRLQELGIKRIRRLGHSMEFEHIREYVVGDDIRTLNWKATARKGSYMVNEYVEEKSQPVYCVIDKGRQMKMPFEGLSLLDYAINATLVVSNIAMYKQDKAGVITFSEKIGTLLPADRKPAQMHAILELLYKQKTRYLESNYEALYANINRKVKQRSLILLFTNFETLSSMQRVLPYLRNIARGHLLVVIFFENTELRSLLDRRVKNTEDVYIKTIAEKYAYERRQIIKELQMHGIHSMLTTPANLTVNTLNKYLEIKARGML